MGILLLMFVGCGGGGGNSAEDGMNNTTLEAREWTPPGGDATVPYDETNPFLTISKSIDESELSGISQGRELFLAQWDAAPGFRSTLDGLGPLFNANACTSCHVSNGRITPYNDDGTLSESFLFRIGNDNGVTHPKYGGQFQTIATSGIGETELSWTTNASTGEIEFLSTTDIKSDGFSLGPRISPHLLGMGLLDLVLESTILEYEDINDTNADNISGRAHWIREDNVSKIGRFGWKAINTSLRTQNAGALNNDMGLTSPVNTKENCTDMQTICGTEINGGSPEVSETSLDAIVRFMTALGVPDRRINDQEKFDRGAEIFENIQCASCHRTSMSTGTSTHLTNLSNQIIYPYTDLLLHDMGEKLSDGVKEIDALGREWRTAPLWGLGIVEKSEGARFLHDGRANTIKEAILEHAGESLESKNKFQNLNDIDMDNLLEFLRGI